VERGVLEVPKDVLSWIRYAVEYSIGIGGVQVCTCLTLRVRTTSGTSVGNDVGAGCDSVLITWHVSTGYLLVDLCRNTG